VFNSPSLALSRLFVGPRRQALVQPIVIVAGSALIALAARLSIPLPFSPVPITGQTLAVLLLAGLLGRRSAISVALYIAEGALGLPILAGNWGGLARLAGPTGGYLLGFALGAYVAGWLAERSRGRWLRLLGALLVGQALIYTCGLLWLSRFVPAERLLLAGLYPFLVGDAYKLAVALGLVLQMRSLAHRLAGDYEKG